MFILFSSLFPQAWQLGSGVGHDSSRVLSSRWRGPSSFAERVKHNLSSPIRWIYGNLYFLFFSLSINILHRKTSWKMMRRQSEKSSILPVRLALGRGRDDTNEKKEETLFARSLHIFLLFSLNKLAMLLKLFHFFQSTLQNVPVLCFMDNPLEWASEMDGYCLTLPIPIFRHQMKNGMSVIVRGHTKEENV